MSTFTRDDVQLLRDEVGVYGEDRCATEAEEKAVNVVYRRIADLADRIEALVLAGERALPAYTPTTPDPARLTLGEP